MESIHRLTMNTSLKNAKIFDDDAWDENDCPKILKEVKQEPQNSTEDQSIKSSETSNSFLLSDIKEELENESDDSFEEDYDDAFDEGQLSSNFCNRSIKQESQSISPQNCTLEDGELQDSLCQSNIEATSETKIKVKCETPSPPIIKPDPVTPVDRMFDESPYNKQLFSTLMIKEETSVRNENEESCHRNFLKSAKRTVFRRHSPYKKIENDNYDLRISAKSRLGPRVEEDEDMPRPSKYRKKDMESDPIVIARREKQIEYGKNTIGYENYIKMVPRSQRTRRDPQTPPKYEKYSRRGWEGLIRQWRIQLHNYDPPDSTETGDNTA